MNATDKIDAARIELLLGELRLPWRKPDCRRERPSTPSTSMPCR